MLPFLQPKKLASVIALKHKKDGSNEPSHEEGEHTPELMSASEELINAVHSKDANRVAAAVKAIHNHVNIKESSNAFKEE